MPEMRAGEAPLLAFVSSVMDSSMQEVRDAAVEGLNSASFMAPWAFEYTPPSAEAADQSYLEKVRQADVFIWLVGHRTTNPVRREVEEALSSGARIIAIRLQGETPDELTESTVRLIGLQAKWSTVPRDRVRETLSLALGDEIVRAWRNKPGRARQAILDERGRLSRARCIQSWQAAGMTRADALALAEDRAIGAPPPEVLPSDNQPLKVVVADVGAGKSLVGERYLQEALRKALEDVHAPVPMWFPAREVSASLLDSIRDASTRVGDLATVGASIVVDGADEAGAATAGQLLSQARIAVETWPHTTVLLSSRPLAPLDRIEEEVRLPLLSAADALQLVGRVCGLKHMTGYGWPASILEAIRRPLFAILLGNWLRDRSGLPRSVGEMLRALIQRLPTPSQPDAQTAMVKLGRLSTDHGEGPVIGSEVGNRQELEALNESGLVVLADGALSFALPILTQYFAARSLMEGRPDVVELCGDSERLNLWRYALTIAIGELSYEQASSLLAPIVETNPGYASQIVSDAFRSYSWSDEDVVAQPALEAGRRVRKAMESWLTKLPVARMRFQDDGMLRGLAVGAHGSMLTIVWRPILAGEEEVIPLPADIGPFQLPEGWGPSRSSRPTNEAAWPWRWTLDDVVAQHKSILARHDLPVNDPGLFQEQAWAAALAITGSGRLRDRSIALSDLLPVLTSEPRITHVSSGSNLYALGPLRDRVARLQSAGEGELAPPWPGPDRGPDIGGWVWSPYSEAALLKRTSAVFEAALRAYCQLVETWFPAVGPSLQTYATLPATLVGKLEYDSSRPGYTGGPVLQWYLDPKPRPSDSSVEIQLGSRGGDSWSQVDKLVQDIGQRLRVLRPEARRWIFASYSSTALDIFGAAPATEVAYGWLIADLKRVKLTD